MAKFKVGDKVKVKGAGVETIKAVYPKGKGSGLDSTQVDMSVDWYETDGGGMIADEDIVGVANSRACNSTNPVVANAMRARNATYQYHDYDVPVIQLGHRKYITIMGVADEETAKSIVRSKPGITIDESRKVKVKNAGENISGIAVNWKRNDAALKVVQAIDLLVGTHNSSRNWIDVDAEDKNALSIIGKSIADLNRAWKILLRERA